MMQPKILRLVQETCAIFALLVASLSILPIEAYAQDRVAINIPAGRLNDTLRVAGRQANITVIGISSGLSDIRTPAVRGRLTSAELMERLLRATPYRARKINPRTFRIERRQSSPRRVPKTPSVQTNPDPTPALRPPPPPPEPIIVSATKLDYALREYPGAAHSILLEDISTGEAANGLDSILSKLPVTSGTALGSGQNKIFVRGIADSSFNGPTQSTIGLYLGEQRLTYSASNPDLRLYDMERLELLEGPQGTLYGAGSIGGVIRLAPAAPNTDESAATIWASGVVTSGGAPGYDVAAMLNLPTSETEAVRTVVYHGLSGGYIDDGLRNAENINRSEVTGGRLAIRSELSPEWTFDVSGFGQKTDARDGQYIDALLPGLTQRNLFAQPFGAEIWGVNANIAGILGNMQLVSSTGIVRHDLETRYDSSALPGMPGTPGTPGTAPRQVYDETRNVELFSHETRLSDNNGNPLSWLIGISALRHQDDYQQLFTNANGDDPPPFLNIVYKTSEYALFGEASYALNSFLTATLGGRLLYTRGKAQRTFGATNSVEPKTDSTRFLPVAALSMRVSDDVTAYARFQQGYRTNGITVERLANGDPRISRFDPDKVDAFETGIKGRTNTDVPIEFTLSGSYMRWSDVQADLIDANGFTITRNIGDADIFGLSMQTDTALHANLHLTSSFFLNHSQVMRSTPRNEAFSTKLPNIAPYGARLSLRYRIDVGADSELVALASLEYTGESVLDINAMEQVRQGNYASGDISLTWRKSAWEIGLEANNLTNTRGNRFSFGNPFKIRREDQQVPLRPLHVRLSGKIRF